MGRGALRMLGSLLLLATVGLWIADAAGWVPSTLDDRWSMLMLKAALVLLSAAFLLRLVSPMTRQIGKGRCAVCGAATERGHMYCLDHLRETVHAYRDRAREAAPLPPKRRA